MIIKTAKEISPEQMMFFILFYAIHEQYNATRAQVSFHCDLVIKCTYGGNT